MMPFFIPVSPESPDVGVRMQQLESALLVALGMLHNLAERLESRFGPGFLGPEFEQMAAEAENAREQVAQIDELLRQGQHPKAARLVRELASVTWDQAHVIIRCWNSYTFAQRVRCIHLARWVKVAGDQSKKQEASGESPSGRGQSEPQI